MTENEKPDEAEPETMSEAPYRALVEHSSDILCIVQREGKLVYASPVIERILGFRAGELRGRNLFEELFHPQDVAVMRSALETPGHNLEVRCRHQEGHWVYLEMATGRHLEEPVIGVVVSGRDVTERRRAREALRESEEKYRRLFEESRDAICIGTVEGQLLDINPAGVKLFGYDSKEEMLSLPISDLYWNPEDRKRAEAVFTEQGFVEDLERDLKTRAGKRIRVKETASAMLDDEGNIFGFRGILRDVTEQHRLEEQLRQSQKMEAVGRLASGVAHDFNNLLTTINGYSDLILARMDSDDAQRRAVEEIRKAGRRAADMTRRLLTLSRHQHLLPRRLNLNRVVTDMERLLRRAIGEDIEFVTRLDPDLRPIYADLSQIEQIILNLVVNARDAMPEGGRLMLETRPVRVAAEWEEKEPSEEDGQVPPSTLDPGEYALFIVRDSGKGMDPEVLEHAFEPFFTTKERGHNTGLGLAIVYGIVTQIGGHIEIDSEQGKGTTFFIYLPLLVDNDAVPSLGEQGFDSLPRGDEVVLVVEDEGPVRALVQQILDLQGYRVLSAADAETAITMCDDLVNRPDLLLTDVVMPGGSGVALAEVLEKRYPGIKVLFMSGYTDRSDVRGLTEGQAKFLQKPFSPESLARMVRQLLDEESLNPQ